LNTELKKNLVHLLVIQDGIVSSPKNNFDSLHEGVKVRGRVYTAQKPISFNKLWTEEEQKKLEELLITYPDEEVQTRRWEKIAAALGTRTPKQIASRTQKYFMKLVQDPK